MVEETHKKIFPAVPSFSLSDYFSLNPHPGICLLILEGERREKYRCETNINRLPPICTLTGNRTCHLGVCPDWGSNPQPFGALDGTPVRWATHSGPDYFLLETRVCGPRRHRTSAQVASAPEGHTQHSYLHPCVFSQDSFFKTLFSNFHIPWESDNTFKILSCMFV